MPRNIEIKARVVDLEALRAKVTALGPATSEVVHQRDTFFVVPQGRLKVREVSDGPGELIFYQRPDEPGPRPSSYVCCPIGDAKALSAVLARALAVRRTVEKRREVFLFGRTRVHLDQVRGLGSFLEVEVALDEGQSAAVGERAARDLLHKLDIPEWALVPRAYIDLLEEAGA